MCIRDSMCGPCKGNPKAKPPVEPTAAGTPCPHKLRCVNCKGEHSAEDRKCPFWKKKFDREWIDAKYKEVRSSPLRRSRSPSNRPSVAQ